MTDTKQNYQLFSYWPTSYKGHGMAAYNGCVENIEEANLLLKVLWGENLPFVSGHLAQILVLDDEVSNIVEYELYIVKELFNGEWRDTNE